MYNCSYSQSTEHLLEVWKFQTDISLTSMFCSFTSNILATLYVDIKTVEVIILGLL